jgi:hypothetical protein
MLFLLLPGTRMLTSLPLSGSVPVHALHVPTSVTLRFPSGRDGGGKKSASPAKMPVTSASFPVIVTWIGPPGPGIPLWEALAARGVASWGLCLGAECELHPQIIGAGVRRVRVG